MLGWILAGLFGAWLAMFALDRLVKPSCPKHFDSYETEDYEIRRQG